MVFEIEWSEDAIEDFEEIVTYLEQNRSEEIAAEFAIRVSDVVDLLQKMPFMHPVVSKKKGKEVRRCVVTKQTNMFYKVKDSKVTLLAFFDSRQSPDKLMLF